MDKEKKWTNQEMLIAALNDEIDDGGASRESWIHYHINCPYNDRDRRAHCNPDDYRAGETDVLRYKNMKEPDRDMCVECKAEWLESEVDE